MQTDRQLAEDMLKSTEDIQLGMVTTNWINNQMKALKIKPVDITLDTGISIQSITNYKNGRKKLSTITKAFFYYYFKSKS